MKKRRGEQEGAKVQEEGRERGSEGADSWFSWKIKDKDSRITPHVLSPQGLGYGSNMTVHVSSFGKVLDGMGDSLLFNWRKSLLSLHKILKIGMYFTKTIDNLGLPR